MGGIVRVVTGRVVVAGSGRGAALVTPEPLSFWGGVDPQTGEVIDRHHPLCGERLAGRVLLLPHGRGSCSASGVLLEAIRNGTAPAGILTTRVDPIIGLGGILGDELYGRPVPIVVVDPAAAVHIRTGEILTIDHDGTIKVLTGQGLPVVPARGEGRGQLDAGVDPDVGRQVSSAKSPGA